MIINIETNISNVEVKVYFKMKFTKYGIWNILAICKKPRKTKVFKFHTTDSEFIDSLDELSWEAAQRAMKGKYYSLNEDLYHWVLEDEIAVDMGEVDAYDFNYLEESTKLALTKKDYLIIDCEGKASTVSKENLNGLYIVSADEFIEHFDI